jgi:hypothetical protein
MQKAPVNSHHPLLRQMPHLQSEELPGEWQVLEPQVSGHTWPEVMLPPNTFIADPLQMVLGPEGTGSVLT